MFVASIPTACGIEWALCQTSADIIPSGHLFIVASPAEILETQKRRLSSKFPQMKVLYSLNGHSRLCSIALRRI